MVEHFSPDSAIEGASFRPKERFVRVLGDEDQDLRRGRNNAVSISSFGDARQAILSETKRAVTPFGGLAVLVEFWRELGLLEVVRNRLPFAYRSPNTIGAAETLLSFLLSVCAGARRFAHVNLLRGDVALRHLLGWKRLPGDDATRAFFGRFVWKEVDSFFPALSVWLLERLPTREATLDLDSTVFERFGRQEGAKKSYNPRRPGRLSHHPPLAALAEPMFILHGWLAAELIWRDYNQRATFEQRIDELKSDLGADDFCRREFYATEAAFRSVLLLFNLLSLW